jgi:hypothetical protein
MGLSPAQQISPALKDQSASGASEARAPLPHNGDRDIAANFLPGSRRLNNPWERNSAR